MNLKETLVYFVTIMLFLLAFRRMFRRWSKDGNPQVRFAGQVFLLIAVGMTIAYFFLE